MGRAAVDVHGMFVNSLIPSSGVKAEQPSVRPDPWPLAHFFFFFCEHTLAVKGREGSVEHLWSANDANIRAAVHLGGRNNKEMRGERERAQDSVLSVGGYFSLMRPLS